MELRVFYKRDGERIAKKADLKRKERDLRSPENSQILVVPGGLSSEFLSLH